MRTIWNLLNEDITFPSLENIGYETLYTSECDVLVCSLEQLEYATILINAQECFLIVALNDFESEHKLVPKIFDAWINAKELDKLSLMLQEYTLRIDEKIKIREQREIIERFSVDTSVHYANLDGIKLNMQQSTKEIENIFEERVEEMRAIHHDAKGAHEKLTLLKEQIAPSAFAELEESWNMTSSILKRTDEVIKAMFGFIMILQCEDRISQMIDGIGNIMKDDIDFASKRGCFISKSMEDELKKRLVRFYTIQDQRDYANGVEDAMKGCDVKEADIEELTLF